MYPGGTWHLPPVDLRRHRASPSDHADASDSAEMSIFFSRISMHLMAYSLPRHPRPDQPHTLRTIPVRGHARRPAGHRRVAAHPPGHRTRGDHPPASREHHSPQARRPPPRRATRREPPRSSANPGDADPATPRTPRQRHVHHAKTPHHQGFSQTDLRKPPFWALCRRSSPAIDWAPNGMICARPPGRLLGASLACPALIWPA